MILRIARSYIAGLSDSKVDHLARYWIEDSQTFDYGFYEIDSPMEIPWLFQVDSARVLIIDQLSMEVV
jgi:hypothetical protein